MDSPHRHRLGLIVHALAVVTAIGCGKVEGSATSSEAGVDSGPAADAGAPKAGDAPPALATSCHRWAEGACAAALACADGASGVGALYGGVEACVATLDADCVADGALEGIAAADYAGLVACEADVVGGPAYACAGYFGGASAKCPTIHGTLPPGAACKNDLQCAKGTCAFDGGSTDCGHCRDATISEVPSGASCDSTTDAIRACESGNECRRTEDGQRCVAVAAIGESCATRPCASGGVCRDGACAALAGTGEKCTTNDDCRRFRYCEGSAGVCRDVPLVAAGGSCGLTYGHGGRVESDLCAHGTHCAFDPSTDLTICQPLHEAGGSCAEAGDCLPGLACADGTCTSPSTCP